VAGHHDYVDVGLDSLADTVSDKCDSTPAVRIAIYSDELEVKEKK
jgi:hypothetical protein